MKKLVLKTILTAICIIMAIQVQAQHKVSGRLMNEATNTALEIGNVVLTTTDSVYVTGTTTNMDGKFEIKGIPTGDYILTCSYLGFKSNTVLLGLAKSVDLSDIFMSEDTNMLEDVTITGSTVTNKADRLVLFVTDHQKANSSNGINLLSTLQLPRLKVNPLTNEVSLPGDEVVQFCINGVQATNNDIRALQPGEIIRVEYLDNPGLRYGKVDAVINYIIKREVAGGSVGLDLGNGLNTGFGDDQVSAKINYKKSEFGLNYNLRYREATKVWADRTTTFNFADGTSMTRFDKGEPGDFSENSHNISLNYNLMDDKYFFNATMRYRHSSDDKKYVSNQHTSLNPSAITRVNQGADYRQNLPSLDLYYSRSLKNNQTLIFNVVGTYINSTVNQVYLEKKDNEVITDILSDVDGKKYSIIGEGIYEKSFQSGGRFTAGLKHNQGFTNNKYSGTVNSSSEMDQSETYLYAEYSGKIKKFNYTAGVGLNRTWISQEGEDELTQYTFRPKVTLQYNMTPYMFLRLRGEAFNEPYSLSNISAVDQYIDTLQINRGNPNLKPSLIYIANLQYNWRKNIYNVNFNTTYLYSHSPIMRDIYRENGMFIHSFDNHKSWQKLNSELTLSAGPIKDILMISLAGGVNRFISKGNTYTHTYNNFYFRAEVMATYKKFMAMFQAYSPNNHMASESLIGGERIHMAMLMYNHGKFTVGAGIMLPFSSTYKRHEENWNKYVPSTSNMYSNDFSRMVMVKFSWNFNYGRKVQGGNKRLNNQDNDAGIVRMN